MCFRPTSLTLTKTCPDCGTESDATIFTCPKCGRDLGNVEPNMPDANAPGMPGVVFDPSDIGKPVNAPAAPSAPSGAAAPKAPGAPSGSSLPKPPGK